MEEARNYLTPRSRILLEKNSFSASQKFPNFMEFEDSLPCSQKPAIYPYPETGQFSKPHPPIPIIEDQC
jgi:hypothetical protein